MAKQVWDPQRGRFVLVHNRNMASQQLARNRILKARGSKCERCGFEGYVELHHIVRAADGGNFDDSNLVLLCANCHKAEHRSNHA